MTSPAFALNEFEYRTYRRENETAARALIQLLENVDAHYGVMMDIDSWAQSESARDIMDDHLLTRITSAITTLVTDPRFTVSDFGAARLALFHRWLSALFSASPFRNADHILRSYGTEADAKNAVQLRGSESSKFQIFYLTDSEVRLDWDVFWEFDKTRAANLAISLLSTRLMASPSAHQKREMLLRWLPERLPEVQWDDLPGGVIHDAYMHCSYADLPAKHDVKRGINVLIRRKLAGLGLVDVTRAAQAPDASAFAFGQKSVDPDAALIDAAPIDPNPEDKPVVLVILEWFSKNHSIYRTHSQTMVAMRDKFHLIGMGYKDRVDDTGRAVFDEFIEIAGNHLWEHAAHVRRVSEERNAQVAYMPSVGMFPITMVLACLRVAPLQLMALGHPATTHGHAMDYVVVEEDYVGDAACFSEELLKLPKDGMPYRPPAAMTEMKLEHGRLGVKTNSDTVRIAVAATIIKLNPGFLKMCGQIVSEAKAPVEFHFLVGQASGITYPQVTHIIRRLVGKEAVVHKHQNYDQYMQVIVDCDMFLNPFPFGNTNGIVDTVWAGLVGVCKTGREVHEHIDEGMFRRLGFPEWTIAQTHEDYKTAALRMINDKEERLQMAQDLSGPHAIEKLIFKGRPEILGERIQALWQERWGKTPPQAPAIPGEASPMAAIPAWLAQEVEDYFIAPLGADPKVIIDIGANIGAFALRARQQWPDAQVICYEPVPANIDRLRAVLGAQDWASIMPYAVRADAGQQEMFLGDMFVTGGFVKGARQTQNTIRVDCVAASALPPCDLLKIDTEGSEIEILENMDLTGVNAILLEYHSAADKAVILTMLGKEFTCLRDSGEPECGTLVFERTQI